MERLTERIDENTIIPIQENRNIKYRHCMRKLADYEDLEEQGLLIKLPCRIGDKLYSHRRTSRGICVRSVIGFSIMEDEQIYVEAVTDNGRSWLFSFDEFGKTVFLSREEANEALKKALEN